MKRILLTLTAAMTLHALPNETAALLRRHAAFTEEQIAAVRRGERVVRAIPTARQEEVAFAGVTRLPITIASYLARLRAGTLYRSGENVLQIGRFSETPKLADLQNLRFENYDLQPDASPEAVQRNKLGLISCIAAYEKTGIGATGPLGEPARPAASPERFDALAKESGYLKERLPAAYEYLLRYPHVPSRGLDDFFLWTKLTFGFRPLTRVAQVSIWQDRQEAIVVTRQIYANRYFDAGFQVDHLVSDGAGVYLITLNYGRSDLLEGISGKLLRPVVVSRTLSLAEKTLDQAKKDLQTL